MSAMPPRPKKSVTTVYISKQIRTYIDEEVDVDLDDIKIDDMAAHLRDKGFLVVGPDDGLPAEAFEIRLWEAMTLGRDGDVRRLVSDMLYERLGRIV